MREEFVITLYTRHQLAYEETTQRLWDLLDVPLVRPLRYDVVERARKPFDPDAYRDAAALYNNEGCLFIRGSVNGFLAFFSRERRRMSLWRIYLNTRDLQGKQLELWLAWLFTLCETFPVLYGYGCSTNEYNAKHLTLEELPGGGRARRTCGVSIQEFFRYLPGLYWLNIFGKELHRAFQPRYSLLNERAVVRLLAPEQAAFYLREPILAEDISKRLTVEREMAELLGAAFFFDRSRVNELTFKMLPELREELEEL